MLWTQTRRLVILVIGSTVVLIGIAMLVLPGPGTLVIPAGLAILATEFVWARWLLRKLKKNLRDLVAWLPFSSARPDGPRPGRVDPPPDS